MRGGERPLLRSCWLPAQRGSAGKGKDALLQETVVLSLLQLQAAAPEAISVEVNQNSLRFGGENTGNQ